MTSGSRDRRIALDSGLTYNVVDWDGPADHLFVLVHGFADLGRGWEAVAERLATRGRVIAPDLRGHGDSDRIGAGGYYHFLDYVADLDEVVARLAGDQRIILVGHSMGGSVSGYYGGVRPERLAGLALLEGLGPPDLAQVDPVARTASWIDAWRAARRKPAFRAMASLEVAIARLRKNDDLLDEPTARRMAVVGTVATVGGLTWKHDPLHLTQGPYGFRVDVAARFWQRITCPTLIVDGELSRLNLPTAERAARRAHFQAHRYVIVPGAGHALHRHQPAAVADLLLSLL
ncbi:MAG: alpha/beta hydrolase [Proteobacteria bacterium]|nr:alpha/beta hydrolase [Pseudomonadota bacterium]